MARLVPSVPVGQFQGCMSSSQSITPESLHLRLPVLWLVYSCANIWPRAHRLDVGLCFRKRHLGFVGGLGGKRSTLRNFRFCSLVKRIDPLRAGGGRKLLRLWKCLSSFSLPEVCRSSSGGSGGGGGRRRERSAGRGGFSLPLAARCKCCRVLCN